MSVHKWDHEELSPPSVLACHPDSVTGLLWLNDSLKTFAFVSSEVRLITAVLLTQIYVQTRIHVSSTEASECDFDADIHQAVEKLQRR